MPVGDECIKGEEVTYYQTTLELKCDKNIAKIAIDKSKIDLKNCTNVVKMRSQYACANLNKYSFANTVKENNVMIGLALMFLGVYFCWFSYRYIKATKVLTGVTLVMFIAFILVAGNLEVKFTSATLWSTVIISILIGSFVGLLMTKAPWLSSAILGAYLGYVFTEILFQLILSSLSWNPRAVYYIIFSISIPIFAVLGGVFQKHVFILSCAFSGAYLVIRGLGTLQNNFPDEKQIYDLIERNEWWQVNNLVDYKFYLYLTFAFVLGNCGAWYQYKTFFKDIRNDEYIKSE